MSDSRPNSKPKANRTESCLFDMLTTPPTVDGQPDYPEEEQRISDNIDLLRAALDVHQRKLLLRIVDDLMLIANKTARDQYAAGFRMATRILIESLYNA